MLNNGYRAAGEIPDADEQLSIIGRYLTGRRTRDWRFQQRDFPMTRLIRQMMICAACLALQQSAANAQFNGRPVGSNEAQITVNFMIPFASDERDPLKLAAAQSQFRKNLYEIAARECVSLVETIADECRMVSMNINANNQMPMMMATMINANAQYRVVLKTR